MTAQISDVCKHKKNYYSVARCSNPIGFNPQDYGLVPNKRSSIAFHRGYWCEYEIRDDGLYLNKLFINSADEKYPDINGISVIPKEKGLKEELSLDMFFRVYENMNMKIPYTGKIMLGDEVASGYHTRIGFQKPYEYEKLIECIFEEGTLVETVDRSEWAEKMRQSHGPKLKRFLDE